MSSERGYPTLNAPRTYLLISLDGKIKRDIQAQKKFEKNLRRQTRKFITKPRKTHRGRRVDGRATWSRGPVARVGFSRFSGVRTRRVLGVCGPWTVVWEVDPGFPKTWTKLQHGPAACISFLEEGF